MRKLIAYMVAIVVAVAAVNQCSPLSGSARNNMRRREEILQGL